MAPATPTQSVYLHAGDGPVDATIWPAAGFQTPPSSVEGQPVPSEPLYYFAGDTIDPKTTNGASVPDWGLYTGPTEPVPAQDATTVAEPTDAGEAQGAQTMTVDPSQAQTTAPTGGEQAAPSAPTSEQPAAQTDASLSPTDTSSPSSEPAPSSESGSGEAGVSSTPSVAESASQDASAPTAGAPDAPEDPQAASTAAETVPAAASPSPAVPGVREGVVYRPRTDSDVLSGNFCRVVAGEHQGRYGVLLRTETVFVADGWPATVTVRTRDADDELLVVNYADIRPASAGGR